MDAFGAFDDEPPLAVEDLDLDQLALKHPANMPVSRLGAQAARAQEVPAPSLEPVVLSAPYLPGHSGLLAVATTGVLMGILHVLSGPDHLSALAALSASATPGTAAKSGVKWGVGHSTGLLLMGIPVWFAGNSLNTQELSSYADGIVGLVMILLGIWCLRRVWLQNSHPEGTDAGAQQEEIEPLLPMSQSSRSPQQHEAAPPHARPVGKVAFSVGVFHGVAGPGGFLGLLPAASLHSPLSGGTYMVAFCISSVATMAFYASMIAWMAGQGGKTCGRRVRKWIAILSALASIGVGVVWLALLRWRVLSGMSSQVTTF